MPDVEYRMKTEYTTFRAVREVDRYIETLSRLVYMLVSTALPDSDWPHLVKLDHEIKSKLLGVHHIMGKSSSQSSLHMHHVAQFTLYNVMYIRMFHLARSRTT